MAPRPATNHNTEPAELILALETAAREISADTPAE
jgi:hypothetical protein